MRILITQLNRIRSFRIVKRSSSGKYPDEYSGDLIAHYKDDLGAMSDWALLEVVDFGSFADFWLFCAERWEDKEMAEIHYVLKSVKALRNACSHNTCIINGFTSAAPESDYDTPESILTSMNKGGLKNGRSRKKKMANQRVAQIAAMLFASPRFCTRPSTMARHAEAMQRVKDALVATYGLCPADGSLTSYFDFLGQDDWHLGALAGIMPSDEKTSGFCKSASAKSDAL